MPNATSNWSHPKVLRGPRTYAGEAQAAHLLMWLDQTVGTARNARVVDLIRTIELIQKVVEPSSSWDMTRTGTGTGFVTNAPRLPLPAKKSEYRELKKRLNDGLSKYPGYSSFQYATDTGALLMDWLPIRNGKVDALDSKGELQFSEAQAVRTIVELCERGWIDRVRRCPCKKWFFARFKHSQFHSVTCQQKFYRTNPVFRQNRREYMRGLRADHKKRVFASTARPRKSLRQASEARKKRAHGNL